MNIDTNGFELGEEVEDVLSGATGTIVGFSIWTTGCARATIQPPVGEEYAKGGKYPEMFSCDVTMLRGLGRANRLALAGGIDRTIGGPMPTPSRGR